MLRLPVLVGVDLPSDIQPGVTKDDLGIAGRDAEVLEQRSGGVPQVADLITRPANGLCVIGRRRS